jgi:CHRD domain
MRGAVVLLTVAGVLAAVLVLGGAATARTAVPTDLRAFMTGKQEVNECIVAPCADPNGSGLAVLRVHKAKVCYTIDVRRIKPATAASIHRGRRGENGPIVVPLNAPTDGSSSGCVAIPPPLSIELREHPGQYYVGVSNRPFPFGAIRGQLHR